MHVICQLLNFKLHAANERSRRGTGRRNFSGIDVYSGSSVRVVKLSTIF